MAAPVARTRIEGADRVLRKLNGIAREVFPVACARALNRVANTVKTRAARDISKATGLKVSSVKRRIVFRKRASKADLTVVLEVSGKPLNLVETVAGARSEPRSPRVGVTAKAWGVRRKYPGVFLARMPNGQVIAVRRSDAGKRGKKIRSGRWANRSPHIESVWGPGIARTAAQPALEAARREVVRERFPIELQHELSIRISKLLVKRRGRR